MRAQLHRCIWPLNHSLSSSTATQNGRINGELAAAVGSMLQFGGKLNSTNFPTFRTGSQTVAAHVTRRPRKEKAEVTEPFTLSYRRSMFFSWLIRASAHKSRISTLFPAMASLSTALSLSSTAGMWEKLLNERLKLLSCASPPSSSGSELRRFPSKDSVCRLRHRKDCLILWLLPTWWSNLLFVARVQSPLV